MKLGSTPHSEAIGQKEVPKQHHLSHDKAKSRTSTETKHSQHAQERSLRSYLVGATAAQTAQIDMIRRVFTAMDCDHDGLLSASDVKAYFSAINRPATDIIVRKWIRERDIDQDGAVSLAEFVSSFAYQLDPASIHADAKRKNHAPKPQHSHVAAAFGCLRLACSPPELVRAVDAAVDYVQRIIDSPSTKEFWRIRLDNEEFVRNIGRLFGGVKLMLALGFELEDNGQVLALRDPAGEVWSAAPLAIRQVLGRNIKELQCHKNSLLEPSVSNIAAGMAYYKCLYMAITRCCPVSTAIGLYGETFDKATEWGVAVETVIGILRHIIDHPGEAKYYTINPTNPKFHRRSIPWDKVLVPSFSVFNNKLLL